MTYAWHDLVGNIGVVLILATYLLLQMQRMAAPGLLYSVANGFGALLVLVSLTQEFNLSAFAMELVWLLISVYGIGQWRRRRKAPRADL